MLGFCSMKPGHQVGFRYTTVQKCSIHGEDSFFFLVERVFLLVNIGFVGVHSGNINREVFWYILGVFWFLSGVFFGTKWGFFGRHRVHMWASIWVFTWGSTRVCWV